MFILISLLPPILFAIWVGFDSQKRIDDTLEWTLLTLLLAPFTVPVYFANRNLKKGELRKGGRNWNILKNFVLIWTVYIIIFVIYALLESGQIDASSGIGLSPSGIAMLWFFPVVVALVLGYFLKKPSEIEEGPTGPLKEKEN